MSHRGARIQPTGVKRKGGGRFGRALCYGVAKSKSRQQNEHLASRGVSLVPPRWRPREGKGGKHLLALEVIGSPSA